MDDILEKISKLEYFLKWYSSSCSLGKWRSKVLGTGFDFEKISEYSLQDNPKTINWNATARTGGLTIFKNDFIEEKNITVYLVADVSNSMNFGTRRESKKYIAAEIAAIFAYSALRFGDRVGLVTWPEIHLLPPKTNQRYFFNIAQSILEIRDTKSQETLESALQYLPDRKCLVLILSDFLDYPNLYQTLEFSAKFHDLIPILIEDQMEIELPDVFCFLNLKDLETGVRKRTIVTRKSIERFRQKTIEKRTDVLNIFEALGLDYIRIQDDYLLEDLATLFIHRKEK